MDAAALRDAAGRIAALAATLAARGFSPATSGNYSMRLAKNRIAITVSGRDKGRLTADDVMVADLDGQPIGTGRPSAETLLHTQLYAHAADCGAVLHVHSANATLASRVFASEGAIVLRGYELLKAFAGTPTHAGELKVPIVANSQDMHELATAVAPLLAEPGPLWGYLIESHGLYTWGRDLDEALRHLEALDFLLGCELRLR